ncbi:MAG: type II toxin-antitoxin system VapC family toxin [Acidobacteriota bacterium]
MDNGIVYLDSSALVKLILEEPESEALLARLAYWANRVSSELAIVEVTRAARRASTDPRVLSRAQRVLAAVNLLRIERSMVERAALLEAVTLRSLDAIHLASALSFGGDLEGMAVYDSRLQEAARQSGIPVFAPGQ